MSNALPPSDGDRPEQGGAAEASPATPAAPRRTPRASTGTGAARSSSRSTAAAAADDASPNPDAVQAEQDAPKTPAARKPAAKKPAGGSSTAAKAPAARKPAGTATTAAKKPTTPRTRRTTAKAAPIAPEGEAPGIMDATLGAKEPLAPAPAPTTAAGTDTSSSPAEPLVETDGAADDTTGDATTKRLPTAAELYGEASASAPAAVPAAVPASDAAEVPADADEAVAAGPDPEPFAASGEEREHVAPATAAAAVPAAVPAASGSTASGSAASADSAETEAVTPPATEDADAHTPGTHPADPHAAHQGRTVHDLADRLDDSRFFSSLFDFTFTNYVTRKLAGPVYVVGLVLIGLGIVVGFANSLTSAIATHSPIGAFVFLFGVLITLVGAMLSVLLLRVGIEVFCAIIEIAQNTRRRRPPGE
ncbi:DUF4282 domain-containing protein [Leifsonia shinshuensis]|uniref:DUF4282 domain-containing protein n=1 Tax=Leifsonia shinshuensis TaxID=150026 RepID=UPI0028605594|nr:DUF4282 domain-containing protein [Leifsonia shinshuensis]MDR6970482.1 hypothetical protein [Leifsonia shinshuensis]